MGGFLSKVIYITKHDSYGSVEEPKSIVTLLLFFIFTVILFFIMPGYSISTQTVIDNNSSFFPWLFSEETKKKIKDRDKAENHRIFWGLFFGWIVCFLVFWVYIDDAPNDYFLKTFAVTTAVTTAVTNAVTTAVTTAV